MATFVLPMAVLAFCFMGAVACYIEDRGKIAKNLAIGFAILMALMIWGIFQPYKNITDEIVNVSVAENRTFATIDGMLVNLTSTFDVNIAETPVKVKKYKGFWSGILYHQTYYEFQQGENYLGGCYFEQLSH